VQEPHDAPAPAMTPSLPSAEKSEIVRHVFSLPHLGQAMGASASAIARSTSKHVSQSEHLYSYSGMTFTSPSACSIPMHLLYCGFALPSRPPGHGTHRPEAPALDEPPSTACSRRCVGLTSASGCTILRANC
jgi:hypothetical protein